MRALDGAEQLKVRLVSEVRTRTWGWLVVALTCIPILGVLTTRKIFFVRDLSFFFWSRHLWLRHAIASGEAPWWDPYVAAGQSAIADALNQLLMPVTMAVRMLPSDVVSFNLWIALPLPIAGLGTFAFLARRTPAPAAALGACAFALSGPAVSMLNTPNLSWSVALMPWVLWGVSRIRLPPTATSAVSTTPAIDTARVGIVALLFALQGLCGEPVTWASTGALAVGYVLFGRRAGRHDAAPAVSAAMTVIALIAGALLAACQLVPTGMAGLAAHRGALATPDFWSLHPFSLWETLAPHLFGDYYNAFLADLPWMGPLNFGRDPFFYSVYVGPLVLLLALIGVTAGVRRNVFWTAVALLFLVAALGGYTPLYPMARRIFPPLSYFRFPVKYLVFSVMAVAVLAAEGFAALRPREPGAAVAGEVESGSTEPLPPFLLRLATIGSVLAVAGLIASLIALLAPDTASAVARAASISAHLRDPSAGAAFLARVAPPLIARASGLLLAGCLLAALSRRTPMAVAALFAATCADLLAASAGLNLTTEAAKVSPPAWYTASAGGQRLYIGGRVRGFMNTTDRDATSSWQIPAEATAVEGRMELNAELPMAPSGWRVREALSYDLPYLWPADYEATVRTFERAGPAERAAFLRRSGVRRCVLPISESRQWRAVADVPGWNMRVFECNAGATRVIIAASTEASGDPSDAEWERKALFDPGIGDDVVRVRVLPSPAGQPGAYEPPFARIVEDGATRVVVEASAGHGGTLVLRDSFDSSWAAEVDGLPAETARANGRYRAVVLPSGRHVIRFSYRPREFALGLMISGMTALLLVVGIAATRRPRAARRASSAGFTLIELMIVLAIIAVLLSIAFNQYRGMQARGNDVSALASLRSVAAAQWQFAMTCGNLKYASTLPDLAKPVPSTGEGFLSPDLTASAEPFEKSGYIFQMAAKPLESGAPACNGAVPADGYAATADPLRPGVTGIHFYGINVDRILYADEEQTYTGNLAATGPAGHGAEVK